jgi:hypothetical protein
MLALLLPAFAADLDLHVVTPAGAVVDATFRDVERNAIPALGIPGSDERVELVVTSPSPGQWMLAYRVVEERGRRDRLISAPSLLTHAGEPAAFFMGAELAGEDGQVRQVGWRLEAVVREE